MYTPDKNLIINVPACELGTDGTSSSAYIIVTVKKYKVWQ